MFKSFLNFLLPSCSFFLLFIFRRSAFCLFQEFYADKKELGGIRPIFDGRRNVFTSRPLPFDDMATFDIPDIEAAVIGKKREESMLKITLKLVFF